MRKSMSVVVAAGVTLALAGCGGGSTKTSTSAVKSVTSAASPTPSSSQGNDSTSSTPTSKSQASSKAAPVASGSSSDGKSASTPDATVAAIQNAQIPADCQMPTQRLTDSKTPANQMPKQGWAVQPDGQNGPLLLDMAGKGSKQVLWRYGCTAGGVGWPEILILSDAKGNLVSSLDLGSIAQSEHAQVTSWHAQGNNVVVSWIQYEGADSDKQTHQSILKWTGNKLTLTEQPATAGAARPGVPSGAAAGAGGPRPSNATPLTENDHSQYGTQLAFKSPSGANGCELLTQGDVRCGTNGAAGGEFFMSASGQPEGAIADDAPMWFQADTLAYGQVRYSGDTVFASTDQGVTVWNTQSGHGALINTSGIHQF